MSAPANPTLGKRNDTFADSAITRRSAAIAITAPAPAAAPLIAAITGLAQRRMFSTTAPVMRANASTAFRSLLVRGPMMSSTSPPEQKPFPSPVITTAFTASRVRSVAKRSRSSA